MFTYAGAPAYPLKYQETALAIPDVVIARTGRPVAIIDCFGILADAAIRRCFELGCEVKGLGHVKRIKDQVEDARAK